MRAWGSLTFQNYSKKLLKTGPPVLKICTFSMELGARCQVHWAIQSVIQRHPKTALRCIQSYLYASVSNTEPLKIARYTTLCTFWRKIENLEFETHENWIFSIFLRDVSLKKKCLSFKYFYGFFKISPGANIPEEFLVYNLRTVQCLVSFEKPNIIILNRKQILKFKWGITKLLSVKWI